MTNPSPAAPIVRGLRRVRVSVAVALLALASIACSRRVVETGTGVMFNGALEVTNNLRESLQLRASGESGVLWSGSVDARGRTTGSLGPLPAGSLISLRATTATGAVVSARDSQVVRSDVLIWIIP